MRLWAAAVATMLAVGMFSQCEAVAAGCWRSGHACKTPRRAKYASAHASGRVLSPVPTPAPQSTQNPLPRPDLTERPVQPGYAPLPAFLPNNAPPVFAPQPLH